MNAPRRRASLGSCVVFLVACNRSPLPATGDDAGVPLPDLAALPDGAMQQSMRERVLRACVRAATCMPPDSSWQSLTPASRCVEEFANVDWPGGGFGGAGPSRALAERLLKCTEDHGGDCAAIASCFGGTWLGLRACREGGMCQDGKLVKWQTMLSLDCAQLGATCIDLPTGAIRGCCAPECPGTQTITCSGEIATLCSLGATQTVDCGANGFACNAAGPSACIGTGAACDAATERTTCSGSVGTFCLGNRRATLDCAQGVFHTRCVDGGFVPCGFAGSECTTDFKGACQADALLVCLDGRMVPVDCRAVGFGGCAPSGDGAVCAR